MTPGGRGYWGAVGAYVLVLFAVQPFLGIGIDAFKARWGDAALATTVGVIGVAAGLVLMVFVLRLARWLTRFEGLMLALGAAAYGIGVLRLQIPQERLHYVEYGLLTALLYAGLRARSAGALRPIVGAAVLGSALGLLDEALQGWLWPRRYFDWLDVALNVRACGVGLLLGIPIYGAWARRRAARASA